MEQTIEKGYLVRSVAGRDKKKIFLVIEVLKDNTLLLVDGGARKLEAPKKKKAKHVRFFSENQSRLKDKLFSGEKITNAEIRRAILSQPTISDLPDEPGRD